MRVLTILALAAVAGCTTLQDVRQSEPTKVGTFPGAYRSFAECVNFTLDDRVLYDAAHKTALVGNAPETLGFLSRPADYELTVRQRADDLVDVELRQRWTLDQAWTADQIWNAVERCAA